MDHTDATRWHSPHGVPRGARLAPDRMARAIGLAMDVGVSCVEQLLAVGRRECVHRRALTQGAEASIDRPPSRCADTRLTAYHEALALHPTAW